jgi:hypothetical protein
MWTRYNKLSLEVMSINRSRSMSRAMNKPPRQWRPIVLPSTRLTQLSGSALCLEAASEYVARGLPLPSKDFDDFARCLGVPRQHRPGVLARAASLLARLGEGPPPLPLDGRDPLLPYRDVRLLSWNIPCLDAQARPFTRVAPNPLYPFLCISIGGTVQAGDVARPTLPARRPTPLLQATPALGGPVTPAVRTDSPEDGNAARSALPARRPTPSLQATPALGGRVVPAARADWLEDIPITLLPSVLDIQGGRSLSQRLIDAVVVKMRALAGPSVTLLESTVFDSLILQDFALRPRTRWAKQILGSALTLAPCCLNNHWVLVSLRHRPGTSSIISIQNSLGTFANKRTATGWLRFLRSPIPGLEGWPLSWVEGTLCSAQQPPGSSDCGVFVLWNLSAAIRVVILDSGASAATRPWLEQFLAELFGGTLVRGRR